MFIQSLLRKSYLSAILGASLMVVFILQMPAIAQASTVAETSTTQTVLSRNFQDNSQNAPDAANSNISESLSRNWSGYVADTGTYSGITGTWTIPTVPTSNSAEADATWVGIGGISGTDLIQAGTQAITENGQIVYQAWYETLPNASTPVSLTVNPGDSVTATLTNEGGSANSTSNWLITIKDNTTNQQYSQTVSYNSSESSAEWIEEMPSDTADSFIPLDNFGSIAISNGTATLNGVSENILETGAHAVSMTNGENYLAQPSVLGTDGESFTVTRSSASSDVPSQVIQIRRNFSRGGRGFEGGGTGNSYGNGVQTLTPESSAQLQQMQQQIQEMQQQMQQQFANAFGGQIAGSASSSSDTSGQTYTYSLGNGSTVSVRWGF
jgi:hypothetical protein